MFVAGIVAAEWKEIFSGNHIEFLKPLVNVVTGFYKCPFIDADDKILVTTLNIWEFWHKGEAADVAKVCHICMGKELALEAFLFDIVQ